MDIKRMQNGDADLRNKFISEYTPFIIDKISKTTGRYVDVRNAEELSIGLEAFNEAIDKFDSGKGSFLSFAHLVIKSRIIDHMRKESKHRADSPLEEGMGIESKDNFEHALVLRDQIEAFRIRLEAFGITFGQLAANAPKHEDTRRNIMRVANGIVETPMILNEFYRSKRLPRKTVSKKFRISDKAIQGSRQYLISCILAIDSELSEIKAYITGKGGASHHG